MPTPHEILKDVFGFDDFRPGQQDIVETILRGDNVLAVMPTGAGKSLCYQLPALILGRVSIVISPLVALMDNQVAGLRANGVDVACIHSGQSRDRNIEEWRKITRGNAKLLYLSPERLMSDRMLAAMAQLNPAMFVIDEAHCVSKWGPSFRPEYDQLQTLKTRFPEAVIASFTATADANTRADIGSKLFGGNGKTIVQGFDRPNISLAISPKANRNQQLLTFMESMKGQSGIVYCLSRKNTEQFAELLRDAGYNALPYHAGLDARVRFEHQERFMAEEAVIIVATIAFGMGIDKPDIRFVYHTNLPSSLEAYYQEIGRAGRDGAPAVTSMVYGLDDVRMRRQFIMDDGAESDHKIREQKRLEALLAYCEASGCRRQVLLSYFGETTAPCGNCDNCDNPPETIDATAPLQFLMHAIEQTGQRFGQSHIIDVSRGADTARIGQFNHNQLPAFGLGKAIGKPYFQALIRQAVASNMLDMDIARYGALTITAKGRDVMQGNAIFACKEIRANTRKTMRDPQQKTFNQESALTDSQMDLLGRLKQCRTQIARGLGKPAYIVFSDATLIDMAKKQPQTNDEMLDVSGVGAKKLASFGEEFLAIIAQ